jgi:hypothetical protein
MVGGSSNMTILTTENAPNALSVRNRDHPEWGTFRFNYNAQPLSGGGYCSVIGSGVNSRILPWFEYSHWEIVSFRQPSPFSIAMKAFAQAGWDFAKEGA